MPRPAPRNGLHPTADTTLVIFPQSLGRQAMPDVRLTSFEARGWFWRGFSGRGCDMRHVLSSLVIAFAVSGIAAAQKAPQPRKVERVQYYKVEYHRFKPGRAEEGRAFIRKHYRPADRAAGIEVLEFTPVTGDWDWIAFFPVEADFLVWERSPMSLRARAKFEEMAGGPENAKKLDKEFGDLLQELRVEIMARDLER